MKPLTIRDKFCLQDIVFRCCKFKLISCQLQRKLQYSLLVPLLRHENYDRGCWNSGLKVVPPSFKCFTSPINNCIFYNHVILCNFYAIPFAIYATHFVLGKQWLKRIVCSFLFGYPQLWYIYFILESIVA